MPKKFWNVNKESNEIRIDGDIGESFWGWLLDLDEVTFKAFKKELDAINGDVTVWINSDGGSVFEASQIYTALKAYNRGKIIVKVDGSAFSAASVIAMAGDEVYMSPTSVMMIHNPLTCVCGDHQVLEGVIDILEEVKTGIVNAYEAKTGISREEISRLMDEETWMSANKALEMRFADGILFEDSEEQEVLVANAKKVFNKANYEFKSIPKRNDKDVKKAINHEHILAVYRMKKVANSRRIKKGEK